MKVEKHDLLKLIKCHLTDTLDVLIKAKELMKKKHQYTIRLVLIWIIYIVSTRIFQNLGTTPCNLLIYMVARGGIEPPTRGFSILCSTD